MIKNIWAVDWRNFMHWQYRGRSKREAWVKNQNNIKKEAEWGSRGRFAWHPLPTEVQACRRHCSRIFAFSPPLGAGIQVYLPAGTGRTPPRLLRIVCRCAPGSFSCMLDILLNTSFLDDMGDHSKSKFAEFFCSFFFKILTRMCIFLSCLICYSRPV